MARVTVLHFNVVALEGIDGYEPGEVLGSTDRLDEALRLRRDRRGLIVGEIVQEHRVAHERSRVVAATWMGDE